MLGIAFFCCCCTDLCGGFSRAGAKLGKMYSCTLPNQHCTRLVVCLLEIQIPRKVNFLSELLKKHTVQNTVISL